MSLSSNSASRRRLGLGLFVALQLVMHSAVTAVWVSFSPEDGPSGVVTLWMFVVLGLSLGQSSLAAIWIGLGASGFFQRAAFALLAWALSILFLSAIPILEEPQYFLAEAGVLAVHLVLIQVPLALLCGWMGWRLGPSRESPANVQPNQFSVRHLLFWMGGCACVLGIGRFLVGNSGELQGDSILRDILRSFRVAAYPILGSFLFAILAAWATASRKLVGIWIVVLGLMLPAYTYLESLHPYCTVSGLDFFSFEVLLRINSAHVVWLVANLLLVRLAGYRLTRASGPTA